MEIQSPSNLEDDVHIAIKPRLDHCGNDSWINPIVTKAVNGFVRIPNLSSHPVAVKKHQHLAQVYYTSTMDDLKSDWEDPSPHSSYVRA